MKSPMFVLRCQTLNAGCVSVEKENQLDVTELVYCDYNLLDMFRALIWPSSGAQVYTFVVTSYSV